MTVAKKTSPEKVAEIRRRYLAVDEHGAPLEKVDSIAADLGVTRDAVGLATCDLPRREPHQERARLLCLDLAALAVPLDEISKRAGVPIKTVRRALAPTPKTREEIEAERDARDRARAERARAARHASGETPERREARLARRRLLYGQQTPEQREARLACLRAEYAKRKAAAA